MITVSVITYDDLGIIVVVRISEVFRLALNVSGRKKKAGYFVFAVFQIYGLVRDLKRRKKNKNKPADDTAEEKNNMENKE